MHTLRLQIHVTELESGLVTPGKPVKAQIDALGATAAPVEASITRIAPAHLQGMGSVEGVADEKAQIFAGLLQGGAAILPAKDYFFERLKRRVGATMQVLVDQSSALGRKGAVGRSYADAPEIDGKVYVSAEVPLKIGQKVQVQIMQSNAHDLLGELIE